MPSKSCTNTYISTMTSKSLKRYGVTRHFSNEVLFLTHLNHPNIIKVYESAN